MTVIPKSSARPHHQMKRRILRWFVPVAQISAICLRLRPVLYSIFGVLVLGQPGFTFYAHFSCLSLCPVVSLFFYLSEDCPRACRWGDCEEAEVGQGMFAEISAAFCDFCLLDWDFANYIVRCTSLTANDVCLYVVVFFCFASFVVWWIEYFIVESLFRWLLREYFFVLGLAAANIWREYVLM